MEVLLGVPSAAWLLSCGFEEEALWALPFVHNGGALGQRPIS